VFKNLFRTLAGRPPADHANAYVVVRGERLLSGGYTADVEKNVYRLRLMGWIRPHDTFIELEAEGPRAKIEELLATLKEVPMWSRVDQIEFSWNASLKRHQNFRRKTG